MKTNRVVALITCLLCWIFVSSCHTEAKTDIPVKDSVQVDSSYTGHENYLVMYDTFTEFLMNASFTDSTVISTRVHFSDAVAYDTFFLILPPGPVASSMSEFLIKGSTGNILYSESFHTRYFAREIISPDTQASDTGQAAYDRHMINYIRSVNPDKIKQSVLTVANQFFSDHLAARSKLTDLDSDGIVDRELFEEAMNGASHNFIWLPCFDCEEGVNLVGYSRKSQKAHIIYSMD